MELINVSNLSCHRDDQVIFTDVSFSLAPGQLLQVQGKNGAGKSTLLRVLAGLMPREKGSVTHLAKQAYLGHKLAVSGWLTVREHLQFPDESEVQKIIHHFLLTPLIDCFAKDLSAGQRQRLALARIALSQADVWLLDEPFTALDQQGVHAFAQLLQQHLNNKGGVILTSHQLIDLGQIHYQVVTL